MNLDEKQTETLLRLALEENERLRSRVVSDNLILNLILGAASTLEAAACSVESRNASMARECRRRAYDLRAVLR